ncbi:hypothetical protein [Natrinema versiforme]|uniref:Uncharacterized protein n=1 Tax=Natrinema versiforme TaxID=88724 RepID=A0A4P8WMJ3_9EURY|nr:hypothetical protein [Natrinema versiforme]QCS44555.1 hypothetical protein FEJ81_19760 [Natrinema versiforme]
MASRRTVIGASGSMLFGSVLSGCLSDSDTLLAELLQVKGISVRWKHENRTYSDQILQLHSDDEGEVTGQVATEYDQMVSSPTDVTVSKEMQEMLESEFNDVRYVIGVCGDDIGDGEYGCRNAPTPREDFNSVQFGDRADVKIDNNLIDVKDVESGDVEDWNTDISEFEWSERNAEHGQ